LRNEAIEVESLQHALIHANIGLGRLIARTPRDIFDPQGRIEIVDPDGHLLARIYCAEAIAART
jgi:hypothetical protein